MRYIIRKNKALIGVYLILGIFNSFMANYKADYFQRVIDGLADHSAGLGVLLMYGAILAVSFLMNYVDNYPDRKLDHGIFLDFKLLALDKIRRIDYLEYQKMGTGTLSQQIENGAMAGKEMFYNFWLRLIRDLIPTIGFSIFFIWRINRTLTYAILGGYVVIFIVTNLLLKSLYRIKERILSNEERLNHFLIRGIMEMVVFRLEKQFPREIHKASRARDEIVQSKTNMTMIHEAFFTIFALLVALLDVIILIYAWKSGNVSVGAVVALLALIDNAYTPIAIFNVLFVEYKLNRSAYARFETFLKVKDDAQLLSGRSISGNAGDIEVEHLSFRYGDRILFQDLNLTIRQGEKLALVGESGSGKSTLVKMLTGLIKYDEGRIRMGGQELKELCLESVYDHISYISQDSPIFDGTLRDNLIFDKRITDERLMDALGRAQLSTLLNGMPQGLDTALGERGMVLSGGEKQRVALARLWFEQKDITILDEATSAMDMITEEAVMREVTRLLEGRTVIAIAHRLSSIRGFDRIIVFREGHIVGQGAFQQLMEENEYFAKLYHASIRENQ